MQNSNEAMREALEIAKKKICHHAEYICQSLAWENSTINANCGDILCAHRDLCEAKTAIQNALALPRRQCDVGTAVEQAERFEDFCFKHIGCAEETEGWNCVGCPLVNASKNITQPCELYWAQMPYEAANESEAK